MTAPETGLDRVARLERLMPHATTEERLIAAEIVDAALAQGWAVSVNDGGEWTVRTSEVAATILGAMATTGRDLLRFTKDGSRQIGGWVELVWGNGPDLISDHSARPATEQILEAAVALADRLAGDE